MSTRTAAPKCECSDGYFRYKADVDRPNVPGITWPSSDEGPNMKCSRESHDVASILQENRPTTTCKKEQVLLFQMIIR